MMQHISFKDYDAHLPQEVLNRISNRTHSILADMKFLPELIQRVQRADSATWRVTPRDGFFAVASAQDAEYICREYVMTYDALCAEHIARALVNAVVDTQSKESVAALVAFDELFKKAWGLSLLTCYGVILFGNWQCQRVADCLKAFEVSEAPNAHA